MVSGVAVFPANNHDYRLRIGEEASRKPIYPDFDTKTGLNYPYFVTKWLATQN